MIDPEMPELAPELRVLLAAERAGERAAPAARARVLGQVTAALALPTPGAARPRGTLSKLLTSKAAVATVAFGVGTGTGAVLHARLAPLAEVAVVPSPAPPPQLPALPAPPPPVAVPRSRGAIASGDAALAAERLLIEQARSALTRGEAAAALKALDAHAHGYPAGRLAEERAALRVQALAQAGRLAEAKADARAFHRRYPASLLGPGVDAAVAGGR